jgi:hypothetical protein
MICIFFRVRRSSSPDSAVMFRPSKTTFPASGEIRRIATRPSVVFPQPDSPTSPTVFPGGTSIDTPSIAVTRSVSVEKNDFLTGKNL